ADLRPQIPDLDGIAKTAGSEPLKIGSVDRYRVRDRQIKEIAGDDVPGLQAQFVAIRTDEKHRRRSAARLVPLRKTDQDRHCLGYAGDRQRAKPLTLVEQSWILEALGAERHDPKIGRRVVD